MQGSTQLPPRKHAGETSSGRKGARGRGRTQEAPAAGTVPGGTVVLDEQGRFVRQLLRGELRGRGARGLHAGRLRGLDLGREHGFPLGAGWALLYMPVQLRGGLRGVCVLRAAQLLRQGTGAAGEGRAVHAPLQGLRGRHGEGPSRRGQVIGRRCAHRRACGNGTGWSPEMSRLTLGWRWPLRSRSLGEGRGAQRPGVRPSRGRGREAAVRLGPWAWWGRQRLGRAVVL